MSLSDKTTANERRDGEHVGVIVVHGVGDNYAGWTDHHLVPYLENWVAHETIGRADRANTTGQIALHLKTADDPIVVILPDHPAAFDALIDEVGVIGLRERPEFETQALRHANRDALIDGLEMATSFRSATQWVPELQGVGLATTLAFEPLSGVYRVRDPESSNPEKTWTAFTRRWRFENQNVFFSELFWADMSKVGYTVPSRLSAVLQLFLESPYILGRAFLKGADRGLIGIISWMIMAANWIMRWPISGLHVAVFSTAAFAIPFVIARDFLNVDTSGMLGTIVAGGLVATSLIYYFVFLRNVHKKIGLADLALAGVLASIGLLICLGLAQLIGPPGATQSEIKYLLFATLLIAVAWIAWTVVINLAALLITLIGVKRFLLKAPRGSTPLARPAASASLNILLGIVWKFILTILGFLLITIIVQPLSRAAEPDCATSLSLETYMLSSIAVPDVCLLIQTNSLLLTVAAFNGVALVLVGTAFAIVFAIRAFMKSVFHRSARSGILRLPRVIASPLLVATIFAGSFLSFAAITTSLYEQLQVSQYINTVLNQMASGGIVNTSAFGIIALFLLVGIALFLIEYTDDFVHIGRDLIDHQYYPAFGSRAGWLVPDENAKRNIAGALQSVAQGRRPAPRPRLSDHGPSGWAPDYRRRKRIQRRLEALIESVISRENVDRLVFVAHSQGTVITYDYLVNHDDLIRRTHEADDRLRNLQGIDILTVGSPLTHLYRYYFDDYDRPFGGQGGRARREERHLMSRVRTWTNMWRVDDPIGQHVDFYDTIENVGMPPGGHVNYWREPEVCARVWELVRTPERVARRAVAPIGTNAKLETEPAPDLRGVIPALKQTQD